MSFLQRYSRNESDLADLKQDVYLRLYEAAKTKRPNPVKPFLLTVARTVIVDKVRKDQVVPIEAVADLEALNVAADAPGPDRQVQSRMNCAGYNRQSIVCPRAIAKLSS